ncbi:hypothetical protein, partial [Salmonella sp. s55044]|uniref:hypothetical protein n=1 Tax=Salmonella sp. s55044 TaxID=3159677 RepID=UPI00397F9E35
WNNMNQKVGTKSIQWDARSTDVVCPTEEFPYLYTHKNSMDGFDITPPDDGSFAVTIKAAKLLTLLLAFIPVAVSFSPY